MDAFGSRKQITDHEVLAKKNKQVQDCFYVHQQLMDVDASVRDNCDKISENGCGLQIDVVKETAPLVAESFQDLKDGRQIRTITDELELQERNPKTKGEYQWTKSMKSGTFDEQNTLSKLQEQYHGVHEKETETSEEEIKTTMLLKSNLPVDISSKAKNSEVWNFINDRTKMPNTCKGKQLCTHGLNQELSWDETVRGIMVPDINTIKDSEENTRFGGSLEKIKTEICNADQEMAKSSAVIHTIKTERKKPCKLCQDRDLDTIFLPCGHLVCCNFCCRSQNFKLCPQCFKEIEQVNEAHL